MALLSNYSKECHRRSALKRSISDFRLCRQIFGILNRRNHPLDSQEGSKVCGVAGDDDEREKPPDSAHNAGARRLN